MVGRKRLIGMLAGLVLVVPVPGNALEATQVSDDTTVIEATDEVTDTTSTEQATQTDADSVPLPGLGEVTVDGDVDPEDGSGELTVSGDVSQEDLGVATEPGLSVTGSPDDGIDVDASAPTTLGPIESDPVEELDPVLDVLDDTAPGLVPDVRPEADDPAGAPGGDVRTAGLPGGGPQAHDVPAPSRSVVHRAVPRQTLRAHSAQPTSAFSSPATPSPQVADTVPSPEVAAAPDLQGPLGVPALLRVLAAMLVVATGVMNRWIARELA